MTNAELMSYGISEKRQTLAITESGASVGLPIASSLHLSVQRTTQTEAITSECQQERIDIASEHLHLTTERITSELQLECIEVVTCFTSSAKYYDVVTQKVDFDNTDIPILSRISLLLLKRRLKNDGFQMFKSQALDLPANTLNLLRVWEMLSNMKKDIKETHEISNLSNIRLARR